MIFADSTPSANQLVFVLVFLVSTASGLATVGLWMQGRRAQQREKKSVEVANQPIEVAKAAKRFNAALSEQQNAEINRRLGGHDLDIRSLQQKLETELPEMERRLNEKGEERASDTHTRINSILEAVGELRGEVRANRNKS